MLREAKAEEVVKAMELFIPMVRLKSRQYPKWFSSNIGHDINCLRTLRKRCKSHPSPASLSYKGGDAFSRVANGRVESEPAHNY